MLAERLASNVRVGRDFGCGPLVSTGPDVGPPIAAVFAQVAGLALYFAFPSRYFAQRSNPQIAPIVLGAIVGSIQLICFARAATTDPGLLPRAKRRLYLSETMLLPKTQRVRTSAGVVTLRWCARCAIFQPPGCQHCPICNCCVRGYDHHCPWLATCVGIRNYRFFVGFVVSNVSMVILAIAVSIADLATRDNTSEAVGTIILLVYAILCSVFSFSVCCFHIFLLCIGKTTHEVATSIEPFSLTATGRLFAVLCGTAPPSAVAALASRQKSVLGGRGRGNTANDGDSDEDDDATDLTSGFEASLARRRVEEVSPKVFAELYRAMPIAVDVAPPAIPLAPVMSVAGVAATVDGPENVIIPA